MVAKNYTLYCIKQLDFVPWNTVIVLVYAELLFKT